jgi:hypothetical protein
MMIIKMYWSQKTLIFTIAQNLFGRCGGDYCNIEGGRQPCDTSLASSMYSLVLNGEPLSVSIIPLGAKCHLFQTKPELLSKPYRVESRVSSDSLRIFVGAIGGEAVEINDANVRDLSHLCDEFKFVELAKTVRDWQAEHP